MTIRGHILSVESTGDKLRVKLQGKGRRDAQWASYNVVHFECEDRDYARKALYVGRDLKIEITPE